MGGWRQAAEDVGRDGEDELLLQLLVDAAGAGLDEIDELEQGLALGLLASELEDVGEVEDDGADLKLVDEEGLEIGDDDVAEKGKGLEGRRRGGVAGG